MLSVGTGAGRFSSAQDIHIKASRTGSVMYITDNTPRWAHNEDWWEADVSSLTRLRCIAYRFLKNVFVRCRRTSLHWYEGYAEDRSGSPAVEPAFVAKAPLATGS
jgi:hypothetical protein